MSAGDISIAKKGSSKKSRRRKKRRTADSDSDSSSSSGGESDTNLEKVEPSKEEKEESDIDIELSDIENEDVKSKSNVEHFEDETKDALKSIPYTTTQLTEKMNNYNSNNGESIELHKVQDTINQAKLKLQEHSNNQNNNNNYNNISNSQNEVSNNANVENKAEKNKFLSLLFEHYGDEVNELRNAPDFTAKSLVVLADVLKDGTGMFDSDTLKTILQDSA
ncbi:hypothetical protein TBLA_0I02580 [Henningerozyma blattae CBS 6284]|uniref:Ribosome assembly protein 3 n=1 Tax=Henningerozyma blattae (strain ATCC 34711 / CBS 6284 / DSM 70876 / NBRC 10599 / NRRL Y-10934 / UCD 77-7) TaxID=1071380 RepID=I2H962_HENB6|nr:hypothetical protein TBLA_0I02580 [Tetrapisispora blattae CBS 6284]CCH62914.1 hypothetical protein TBLA_0I02580 [Tetrapisispora blattae CBS 6284]